MLPLLCIGSFLTLGSVSETWDDLGVEGAIEANPELLLHNEHTNLRVLGTFVPKHPCKPSP